MPSAGVQLVTFLPYFRSSSGEREKWGREANLLQDQFETGPKTGAHLVRTIERCTREVKNGGPVTNRNYVTGGGKFSGGQKPELSSAPARVSFGDTTAHN